jgi:uncharacterized SAM-binding protein YcdF (DUF218 family)
MKIIRIILFVIGALGLANAAIILPVVNPTIGWYAQAALSVGLILYAILIKRIPRWLHITAASLCVIPIAFTLFLGIYGNVNNADYNEDAVIVLGAGVRGETVSRILARRLDAALAYWEQNPDAYIVVTGGLGNRASITEAEAMARYLIARGVPQEQIMLEDRSTSTYENLTFAKELLDERFPDGFRAVVVSNDFHMYRARRLARQVGIEATHLGAKTDWYTWPPNYLREMLAVVNAWFNNPLTRHVIPL